MTHNVHLIRSRTLLIMPETLSDWYQNLCWFCQMSEFVSAKVSDKMSSNIWIQMSARCQIKHWCQTKCQTRCQKSCQAKCQTKNQKFCATSSFFQNFRWHFSHIKGMVWFWKFMDFTAFSVDHPGEFYRVPGFGGCWFDLRTTTPGFAAKTGNENSTNSLVSKKEKSVS